MGTVWPPTTPCTLTFLQVLARLSPGTLCAVLTLDVEVLIGVPPDEWVGCVVVHGNAGPILQVLHAWEKVGQSVGVTMEPVRTGWREEVKRRCRQGKEGRNCRARQDSYVGTGALRGMDGHGRYIKTHKQGAQGWAGLLGLPP